MGKLFSVGGGGGGGGAPIYVKKAIETRETLRMIFFSVGDTGILCHTVLHTSIPVSLHCKKYII